jgi:hypothetical protein
MTNKHPTTFKSENKVKNSQNLVFSHSLTFVWLPKLPKAVLVERLYLLKNVWIFVQTVQNEKCKSPSSTDGANERFKVKSTQDFRWVS